MALAAGVRLGPYEILAPLGAGGMGEVYRARDTRLGREVALKVLPEELAQDAERIARFEREARSASALSHAHVVSVFDAGREGATLYIVTEIVAGGSLRDLLDRGAMPLRRAFDLAVQIASGLAEAHERGIVHRDLKPENILLTRSGEAKIADFGLAKLTEGDAGNLSQLPTSDGLKTSEGIVMGTVSYMSPEQAAGRDVDFRSDQFSFGSILYEMLTGRSPFRRPTAGETLAAVMRDEPAPARQLAPSVPAHAEWILGRCLSKEPAGRYASTQDLASELAGLREHLSDVGGAPAARRTPRERRFSVFLGVGIAVGAAATALMLFLLRRSPSAPHPVIRFSMPPPEGATFFSRFDTVSLALSPDGSRLAFIGDETGPNREVAPAQLRTRRVWVRALSDLEARPLAGTEGASAVFWSPDGGSIGFVAQGHLKRVNLLGGAPIPVCDTPSNETVAATWGAREILFCSTFEGVIYRVPVEEGGPAIPMIRPDPARGETRVVWPQFLPGGQSFLYVSSRRNGAGELMLGSLDGRRAREVVPMASRVEYAMPGYIVFVRDGALFAQRFDAESGKTPGPLLSLAPSVYSFYTSKWAGFSLSRTGTLAYASRGNITRLAWFDRSGRMLGEVGSANAGETITLSVSPDGRSVLFDRTRLDLGTYDIWMADLDRGVETRLTSDPNTEFDPVWLPDGKHIVYSVVRDYLPQLVRRDLASGVEEQLLPPGTFQEALDVTRDGRLLFSQAAPKGQAGIWTASLSGAPAPKPVVVTKFSQEIGRLSPDGKLIAFISNESGQDEVYVEAIDSPSGKVRLSTTGAVLLRWRRDGKEIFFTSPDHRLFAVPVATGPSLQIGAPSMLFSLPAEGWRTFDVAPDGRFLAAVQHASYATAPLTVVVNAISDLRQ